MIDIESMDRDALICQAPMGEEAAQKHQRMLEIVKSAMGANTEEK